MTKTNQDHDQTTAVLSAGELMMERLASMIAEEFVQAFDLLGGLLEAEADSMMSGRTVQVRTAAA